MLGTHGRTPQARRKWSIAALLFILSLALSACSSSGTPAPIYTTPPSDHGGGLQTAVSDISAAAAATGTMPGPDASSTPAGPGSYHLAADVGDNIGYTYTLTADLSLGTPTAGDSTNLQPALNALYLPVSGTLTLANTTPGRDAPGFQGNTILYVMGLWKLPSPVCPVKTNGLGEDIDFTVIGGVSYCRLNLAWAGTFGGAGAGESYPVPFESLSDCQADIVCTLGPPDKQTSVYVWLHKYIDSIQPALNQPDAVALAVEVADSTDSLRPAPCKIEGSIILATSPQLPTTRCR